MKRVAPILGLGLSVAVTGCFELGASTPSEGSETASTTATLGRYEVTAELDTQTCGSGTLQFPETLTFVIDLDEDGDELVWGDGALSLSGKLGKDGMRFSVRSTAVVDARGDSTNETLPPCLIERTDQVEGALDDADSPTGFEAKLEIDYAPGAGSDCGDLLFGPERLVQALPCQARYELVGSRSD